jgi:hypothetical protein
VPASWRSCAGWAGRCCPTGCCPAPRHLLVGPAGVVVVSVLPATGQVREDAGVLWTGGEPLVDWFATRHWEVARLHDILTRRLARWPWLGPVFPVAVVLRDLRGAGTGRRHPGRGARRRSAGRGARRRCQSRGPRPASAVRRGGRRAACPVTGLGRKANLRLLTSGLSALLSRRRQAARRAQTAGAAAVPQPQHRRARRADQLGPGRSPGRPRRSGTALRSRRH